MDPEVHIKQLISDWVTPDVEPDKREAARKILFNQATDSLAAGLKPFVESSNTSQERSVLYDLAGTILRNSGSQEVGEFLIRRLPDEPLKTLKATICDEMNWGAGSVCLADADVVLEHASDHEKMVKLRHAAFEALSICGGDPRSEERLLQVLVERKEGPWALYYAIRSLSFLATSKSFEPMVQLVEQIDDLQLKKRKREIKYLAVKTLVNAGGEFNALYLELLTDQSNEVKHHAMRGLSQNASSEDVELIQKRVLKILGSKRFALRVSGISPDLSDILAAQNRDKDESTELLFGFQALNRCGGIETGGKVFKKLAKSWAGLTETEKAYLKETLPTADFPNDS